MKEYIEREAAIALAKDIIVPTIYGYNYRHRCIDPQEIAEIPAADVVEVRHGRWIVCEDLFGEIGHCSACGFFMNVNEPGNGLPDIENIKYCPNCGASMDGGADE